MNTPQKKFGQHFLKDQLIISKILTALAAKPYENLVEIGPGRGALTFPILQQVKHLNAIEIDRDLVSFLKKESAKWSLTIYEQDVLTFDFNKLGSDEKLLRIFGNLPYNISTALLFHLLKFTPTIKDMLFMLQKEVANRLCAIPGNKVYGRLSVMAQYQCQMNHLFDVPPNAFYPPPSVTSSIIYIKPFPELPVKADDEALFRTIVRESFNQRRKLLRNSLKRFITEDLLKHNKLSLQRRPEELSVHDFVLLANEINSQGIF